MSLSVENLRCFVAAARLRNFRTAARAVALSPAALGQRIRQLEADLNTELFTRTTRSVALTRAGLDLLPQAQRALTAVEDCRRASRGEIEAGPMELVLGTRHELGLSWIVPMLDALEGQHPGLTLHLYFGSGPDLISSVRRVEIDCAVTSSRLVDPTLEAETLHQERYAFVGARTLLKKNPLTRAEHAQHHTLLDASEDLPLSRYWCDAPGAIDSQAFRRVICLGTIDAIRALVLRGKGVAVLPEYFIAKDLKGHRLVRILPQVTPLHDQFRLIFRRDDPKKSLYSALATVMRRHPLR